MNTDLTEEEVKKHIRSLLASNARVPTLRNVETDYKSLIGFPIPSRKLGYNSTEHFLKSIPDVCIVKGSGPFAEVLVVVNEKIAHINDMVLKQKVTTHKSGFGLSQPTNRRRRSDFSYSNPGNMSNHGTMTASSSKSSQEVLRHSNLDCYNNTRNQPFISYQLPNRTLSVNKCSTPFNLNQKYQPNLNRLNESQPILSPVQPTSIRLNNTQPILKPPQLNLDRSHKSEPVNLTKPHPGIVRESNLTIENVKQNAIKDLVEQEDNSNVPKKVQENLKKLIATFENGLWCGDLRTQYLRMFRRELLFTDYGYGSLIDMCIALNHIFHYVRPGNDDFKLYDKAKPLPETVERTYTIASYDPGPSKVGFKKKDQALPELEWSDFQGRIPDDVFQLGEYIPRQFLPQSTKVEDVFDVVVMEIYDLSKFWFYLCEKDEELDALMEDLQVFYMNPDNAKEYSIIPAAVQVGLYCVQIIFNEYHRAKVLKILSNEQVRLLYIDYGTVATAPIKGMCFLREKFTKLPAQAIRGRLASVIPLEKSHPWPPTAVNRFQELVNRRTTQMKVSFVDWSEQYVCGFIADVTDPKNVKYVNEVLVKEGHALWENQTQKPSSVMSQSKCIVQNVHLFPTFAELELSMAPNFVETDYYSKLHVPVQYCLPNYFQVGESIDDSFFEMCEGFMATVKNRRKFQPFYVRTVEEPPLDLNIFGDFKNELLDYLKEIGEEPQIDSQHEPVTPTTESEQEELSIYIRAREKCESLFTNLTLGSESPENDTVGINQESEDFSDDEDFQLSAITEISESERSCSRSPPFCSWPVNTTNRSDLNIFDNPEVFEDLSGSLPDSQVTPDEFFKSLETRIETHKLDQAQFLNTSLSNCSEQTSLSDNVVSTVKSNLDLNSKEFVSTLSLNNPFRQFLVSDKLSVSEGETSTGKNSEAYLRMIGDQSDSDSTSFEDIEEKAPPDVDILSNTSPISMKTTFSLTLNSEATRSSVSANSHNAITRTDQLPKYPTWNQDVPPMVWPHAHWTNNNGPVSYQQWFPQEAQRFAQPQMRPPPGYGPIPCEGQPLYYGNYGFPTPTAFQYPSPHHNNTYLPPRAPFVNMPNQYFYDGFNGELPRQLHRNS